MEERLHDESGFGVLELLIALVVLNIALFATVAAFNSATVAISRSARISAATAVADKQMEIYRSLENCAIWLSPSSIPAPSSSSPSLYQQDTMAYSYTQSGTSNTVSYFDNTASSTAQAQSAWATSLTSQSVSTGWSSDIPTSCTPTAGTTPPSTATTATQTISGPDGVLYPVYTYIVIEQPTTSSSYVKLVTIVVRDPLNTSRVLARESSVFNPLNG